MYILNLSKDSRVLSATLKEFDVEGVVVDTLPEGNIADYLYINNEYIYSPLPIIPQKNNTSILEQIEAQVLYTAMMTDTLI